MVVRCDAAADRLRAHQRRQLDGLRLDFRKGLLLGRQHARVRVVDHEDGTATGRRAYEERWRLAARPAGSVSLRGDDRPRVGAHLLEEVAKSAHLFGRVAYEREDLVSSAAGPDDEGALRIAEMRSEPRYRPQFVGAVHAPSSPQPPSLPQLPNRELTVREDALRALLAALRCGAGARALGAENSAAPKPRHAADRTFAECARTGGGMSEKNRLLLVDDEPRILEGLQRLLRPLRPSWDIATATSGQNALDLFATEPFDLIITDMRMPEMDGASLLAAIMEKHPRTVRFVLSGQTDPEATLRAVRVAHQFIHKPCTPTALIELIERSRRVGDALHDDGAREALGALDVLPSLPGVCAELTALLRDADVSIAAISEVLEKDPAMTAKLLQLVNSSFFGLRRTVFKVGDAVRMVGVELIKNLVMSFGILRVFKTRAKQFSLDAFQDHAVAVATLARHVSPRREDADACFAAGLLHDVGKLVLAANSPDDYDALASRAAVGGVTFDVAEAETKLCGHAQLGACLLNVWGLPWSIVEAVAYHDDARPLEPEFGVAGAVHVAHQLVAVSGGASPETIDRAYLERHDLLARLPGWLATAKELPR